MRFPQWFAPVFGLTLAATTCRVAVAQTGPPGVDPYNRVGTGLEQALGDESLYPPAGYPAPLAVPAQYVPPAPAVVPGPPAAPPGALPWPNVSPFEHSFSEHYIENGLWMNEWNDRNRDFFVNLEYMYSQFKRPDGLIGQVGAASYASRVYPIATVDPFDEDVAELLDSFVGVPQDPFSPGVIGNTPLFVPGGIDGSGFRFFSPVDASETDAVNANGFRVTLGVKNPDYSGIVVQGWYNGRDNATFDALRELSGLRNGPFIDPELTLAVVTSPNGFINPLAPPNADPLFPTGLLPGAEGVQFLQQNLSNLGGLPVDDGTLRVIGDRVVGGTTIPYDLQFIVKNSSESAGTSVNFVTTRFVDKSFFHMQGLVGARYMFIRESFNFFGQDSGLSYDNLDPGDPIFPLLKIHALPNFIDEDGDGIIDPAGFPELDDGDATFRVLRLDLIAQLLGVYHPGAYSAFVDSHAESNLWGPEAGLTYDLGGEKFKLTGITKVGLMVNHEKINLRGDNIGEANNIGNNIDPADPLFVGDGGSPFYLQDSPLLQPTPDNPRPNFFTDSENHTHVSPMFEQTLQADVPVFGYIPLVNKLEFLEEATMNFGITYTYLGEIVRPDESIRWTANPRAGLFPEIELKRDDWHVFSWTVGVNVPF